MTHTVCCMVFLGEQKHFTILLKTFGMNEQRVNHILYAELQLLQSKSI